MFHRAIRKYGWDSFTWEVLEQSEDGQLLLSEREEFYIRKFNSHCVHGNGYNMTFGGEATLGWVPSEETRKKISEANKGKIGWNKGKSSPWTSKRNRENAGKPRPFLEKTYRVVSPTNEVFIVRGMKKFCREHNLSRGNMSSVSKGKLPHTKGWTCSIVNDHKGVH